MKGYIKLTPNTSNIDLLQSKLDYVNSEIERYNVLLRRKIKPNSWWRKLFKLELNEEQIKEKIEYSFDYLLVRCNLQDEKQYLETTLTNLKNKNDVFISIQTFSNLKVK